jgi:hypothetical protein
MQKSILTISVLFLLISFSSATQFGYNYLETSTTSTGISSTDINTTSLFWNGILNINQTWISSLTGGSSSGNPFDQSLNTTDDVEFASLSTKKINFTSGAYIGDRQKDGVTYEGNIFITPSAEDGRVYIGEGGDGQNYSLAFAGGSPTSYSRGSIEYDSDEAEFDFSNKVILPDDSKIAGFKFNGREILTNSEEVRFGKTDSQSGVPFDRVSNFQLYMLQGGRIEMFVDDNDYIPSGVFGVDGQSGSLTLDSVGNSVGYVTMSTSESSGWYFPADISTDGKLTASGGIDPPYMLYDNETRTSVLARIRKEIPPQKANGIVHFFNSELNRMEYIKPSTCEVMIEKADKEGIIGFAVIYTINDGKPCYNPNVKTTYRFDQYSGKVKKVESTIYEKYSLPNNTYVNESTGKIFDSITKTEIKT